MARRALVAGNWKMNGTLGDLAEIEAIRDGLAPHGPEAVICPPATLVASAAEAARGSALAIGGQDCHAAAQGAHTGDIAAEMLADAGATHVILGHSERRAGHGETDAAVAAKVAAAQRAGLTAILCVGETSGEREAGQARAVVESQLSGSLPLGADAARLVVAYEPVWAIGSGATPSEGEIAEMHAALRAGLVARFGMGGAQVRLLYGGSVKPANAAAIFALDEVDGGLIGGASLRATDFLAILAAAR